MPSPPPQAFDGVLEMFAKTAEQLLADTETVTNLLKYHASAAVYPTLADLVAAGSITSKMAGKSLPVAAR